MSRQQQFTNIANDVSTRYTSFLETILASYNRAILSADLSARTTQQFKKEVENIHKHYLEREVSEMVGVYEQVKDMVAADTKGVKVSALQDDEWSIYLSENTNFLFDAIKLQSSKDILYINSFLRSKVIQMRTMNEFQAAYQLVRNHKDLSFYYTDKIGRKIISTKYMRTVTRDFLVKNYNDLIAGTALLNGIEEVVIWNIDTNHDDNGKTIAVASETSVNYFAIREETFHPNTNSIIRLT